MEIIEFVTIEEVKSYFKNLEEKKVNTIALDIECEFNLHCYGQHLCLIQIYDGTNEVIIDPFHFSDKEDLMEVLKLVFEKRNTMKLMYDSSSDATLLESVYGIKIKSVFDLRPMVQLLDYEKQSLSNILHEELGLPLKTKKKFQMYNWMRRPIDSNALEYAISDVLHLYELKDVLLKHILDKGLFDKYMLMNLMAQNKEYNDNPEDVYKKRKGYNRLPEKAKGFFRDIYDIREKYAEIINKPPNTLLNNNHLIPLAKHKVEPLTFLSKNVFYKINRKTREDFVNELVEILSPKRV